MKALSTKQAAAALGVSTRTLKRMVQRGQLRPVPGSGGQGRAARFDAAAVAALAQHDLAPILARALAAFRRGSIPERALDYFGVSYERRDDSGRLYRVRRGVGFLDQHLPALAPDAAAVAHSRRIRAKLSRAESLYLVAAVFASAHPLAARYNDASPTHADIVRGGPAGPVPLRRRWLLRMEFGAWPAVVELIAGRSPAEKAVIADADLLQVMVTHPADGARGKLARQVRRIAAGANVTLSDLRRFAAGRMKLVVSQGQMPTPAAVARVLCVTRMQASRLQRRIRAKLPAAEWAWFASQFATASRTAPPVPVGLSRVSWRGQTVSGLVSVSPVRPRTVRGSRPPVQPFTKPLPIPGRRSGAIR